MVELRIPVDVVETQLKTRAGFFFRSGHVALDLVATVAKRDIADRDLLVDPPDLARWIYVAGLPEVKHEIHIDDLVAAREVREAINGLCKARVHDGSPAADHIALVNHFARQPTLAPQFTTSSREWNTAVPVNVTQILALIANETIDLFTGEYADRIRLCRGHDCALYFVDRSRAGSRSWCAMPSCGMKSASARYRRRHTHTGN